MDEETLLNTSATPEAEVNSDAGPSEPPLSKKAQKRAAKRARYEETKLEKRAAERARRRERAQYLSKGYAEGTLSAADAAFLEKQRELKRARKTPRDADVWAGGVIIDLGFDGLMTEQEISSMHSQLGYVYSTNRTAKRPFAAVLHTSFSPNVSPRLWNKMGKAQWHRWNRMWFSSEDVGVVAAKMRENAAGEGSGSTSESPATAPPLSTSETSEPVAAVAAAPVPTSDPYADLAQHLSTPLPSTIPATHKLVYLSADADEELTTLAEDEVYVIGGIVDRNRHKMLCQNKAESLNIRTARLPIGTYLANLPTRKVLTVNQVFEILSQYLALQDWAAAFEAVIPQRKYFVGKGAKAAARGEAAEEEEAANEPVNEADEPMEQDGDGLEPAEAPEAEEAQTQE